MAILRELILEQFETVFSKLFYGICVENVTGDPHHSFLLYFYKHF